MSEAPGVVPIRWAELDAAPLAAKLTTANEHTRSNRFLRSADRSRSLIGAALLRIVAAEVLNLDPAKVPIERKCRRCNTVGSDPSGHGRPVVMGSALNLSLSHSGDLVCAAASWSPVGIDVEKVRRLGREDIEAILAPVELASEPTSDDAIATWVRKESFLKATGEGLTAPTSEVQIGEGWPTRRAFRPAGPDREEASGRIWDLKVPAGYRSGLTVLSESSFIFDVKFDALAKRDSPTRHYSDPVLPNPSRSR